MNDNGLIIALKLDGMNDKQVREKMECGFVLVRETWQDEKDRRKKLVPQTMILSDIVCNRGILEVKSPVGITEHGLVTHVIMDLDHYLELTK